MPFSHTGGQGTSKKIQGKSIKEQQELKKKNTGPLGHKKQVLPQQILSNFGGVKLQKMF